MNWNDSQSKLFNTAVRNNQDNRDHHFRYRLSITIDPKIPLRQFVNLKKLSISSKKPFFKNDQFWNDWGKVLGSIQMISVSLTKLGYDILMLIRIELVFNATSAKTKSPPETGGKQL